MTPEHKQSWICQTCRSRMPKKDNSNTPIRPRDIENNNQTPIDNTNITIRKKHHCSSTFNESQSSDDASIMGNTLQGDRCPTTFNLGGVTQQDDSITAQLYNITAQLNTKGNNSPANINIPDSLPTLQQISELLDKKLENMEKSILSKISASLEISLDEIKEELKSQFLQINVITAEQSKILTEFDKIRENLKILEDKNKNLQIELEHIKQQNEQTPRNDTNDTNYNTCERDFTRPNPHKKPQETCEKNNKIVIYGLEESQPENEDFLIHRITYAIYEITGIDVTGIVEDIARIGKQRNRSRPVVVELISKRVTRNILQNEYCFRGTGLYVTKYLNEEGRARRKKLQEHLYEARKNGHRAIIRDNNLIINGRLVQPYDIQSKRDNNTEEIETTQNNITFQYKKRQSTTTSTSTTEQVNKELLRKTQLNNNSFSNHSFRN